MTPKMKTMILHYNIGTAELSVLLSTAGWQSMCAVDRLIEPVYLLTQRLLQPSYPSFNALYLILDYL